MRLPCTGYKPTSLNARACIGVWAVTCEKDYLMHELWDDRVVQVEKNTGRRLA